MSKEPLVSIIIPTYNRAHLIGETLDSVLAQTYTNWECIVVDDGSKDGTQELIKQYCFKDARFQYHDRPKDRLNGGNAARNYGFEVSKGKYVNWFDSDDLMHASKLEVQVSALRQSDFNFCVCHCLIFEHNIENLKGLRHNELFSDNSFEDYLLNNIGWLTPSSLWSKNFLLSLNYLFDETLKAAQEWEFHCRVLNFCSSYQVIEIPLVYIRSHGDSISYNSNNSECNWNYIKARLKVADLEKVVNSNELKYQLNIYNLKVFKRLILNRYFFENLEPIAKYFFTKNGLKLKSKLCCFIAILTYSLFNKGYFFLKKVKVTH